MKKLFLFDSFAIIFRAYFAMQRNPLINSKNQNVSAISGFVSTLWEIIQKYQPTHLACCFDMPGDTIRHEEFEAYKANRQETPEDIIFSVPYIKEILKGFNIPILEMQGYEADDVIGTVAQLAAKHDFETHIVTMDKDLGQLVTDKIFIHRPPYMGNPAQTYGVKEICDKWQIENPLQLIDILGLMGDAVDNIPGVLGVGEKTAIKLINQYNSVENIYNHIDEIKGKLQEKLIEQKDQALMSKQLATVYTDVPVEFNEANLKIGNFNTTVLTQLFSELEFRTLGKRILGKDFDIVQAATVTTNNNTNSNQMNLFDTATTNVPIVNEANSIESINKKYIHLKTEEEIKTAVDSLMKHKVLCFDTETTGLDPLNCKIVAITFSVESNQAYFIRFPEDDEATKAILQLIQPLLANENSIKIAHNIKYDDLVLKQYQIEIKGVFWDTMIAHYLMQPDGKHGMDRLAQDYLNYTPIAIESLIGKKGKAQGNMQDVDDKELIDYACEDADITLQLYHIFNKSIEEKHLHKLFYDVESPLIEVLADMEYEGVNIDVPFLKKYSEELAHDIVSLQDEIYQLSNNQFNLDSPKQLGEILFDVMKIPYQGKKTKTGQYSTDEATLSKLENEHPIIEHILNYRELTKLKSTYVDALPNLINPKTHRIHTTFNQAVAATGRLSSNNPNLQNIPIRTEKGRIIRQAFVPRNENYTLLSADYSQIELRIVASISGDENMMNAFNNGIDVHTSTAANVYGVALNEVTSDMRRKAKMVNFGIIYGISAFGLAQRLAIPKSEAAELIEQYFVKYNGIKQYMDDAIAFAKKHEYAETLLGRRRYLRDINAKNFTIRSFAERNAINAPIQGTAADMIKLAMINIQKQLNHYKLQSKLILQVHDELLLDVLHSEKDTLTEIVHKEMQNALPLRVPIEVTSGFGNNWLEAH
ncbi:MAG: DNA polymerase I [Chitinophagales bacterium]|nr:DNA polymerase I [Chitinophagales bacterium]